MDPRALIDDWLREDDPEKLQELRERADRVRAERVGDEVHLRGLIDFGNLCRRNCLYCGLRAGNRELPRFRMSPEEILDCARAAADFGYGTVVLQAGEDETMSAAWLAEVIRGIKDRFALAVTISVGERPFEDYRKWREAGADRLLLKFETSDPELYARIHPAKPGLPTRIELLKAGREMGYEIGSGVMIGLPGQTYQSLADDLMLFHELDLDMIGSGPFIPNPDTPLGKEALANPPTDPDQVPASSEMTLKVIALTRLLCPQANLPATTALSTLEQGSYLQGLRAGANVIMPQVSPPRFRELYRIYPGAPPLAPEEVFRSVMRDLQAAGRRPGRGPGGRLREKPPA